MLRVTPQALVAECLGTALLLCAIVGSGIMAEQLFGGNVGLALLANAIATGGALVALIFAFGSISGAHLNPAVTAAALISRTMALPEALAYSGAQIVGALAGTALANAMFGLPLYALSQHGRGGTALVVSEFIATAGLILVIRGTMRANAPSVPFAVAAYIVGAYWFTPSTSFANPAVTLGRALTDTFTGIRPYDVAPFIIAQLIGAAAAAMLFGWLVLEPQRRFSREQAESAVRLRPQ